MLCYTEILTIAIGNCPLPKSSGFQEFLSQKLSNKLPVLTGSKTQRVFDINHVIINKMEIFNYAKKQVIHHIRNSNEILVSDTTLRDGEQMPFVFFTPSQKTEIANLLVKTGVHSIDAGFPICSEGEKQGIKAIVENAKKSYLRPIITTLSRAKKEDIDASYECLQCLNKARRGISIFLGSSLEHRRKLGRSKQEIIEMTRDSVNYAKNFFEIVSFSPEDASRTELEFLVELYSEAIKAGASSIGFTDTVGILTPDETKNFIRHINKNVRGIENALFAVHFHNNLGLAVANTLAGIETGHINIFQGTVGGIGEGAGNTAIEPVVMALKLHKNEYKKYTKIKTEMFHELYKVVKKYSEIELSPFTPVVGENIFRTEAGIHQDGILKNPETYEIFPPEKVGIKKRVFVLGKHSGRHAIFLKLNELGYNLTKEKNEKIYRNIKGYCDMHGAVSDSKLSEIIKGIENEHV